MAQIKPFQFHLAKLSKAHNQIVQGLLEFLPATGVRETFHLAIRKSLYQYLPDIRYYLEMIEPLTFHDFYVSLPSPCCVGVIGLEPFKEKAFVELDPVLSYLAVEKLLGGKGEEWGELHPLTETEQGVIEFLLLKLLSQIHRLCGEQAKLHFRLEQMMMEASKLRSFQREDLPLVCLKVHVSLLKCSGFVKIFLPNPWILEGFLKDLPGDKKSMEHKELKKNFRQFDYLPLELWSALGEAQIPYGDFKNLEEGDVMLFDETGLMKKKGEWQGEVKIFTGKGESGGLTALWEGFKEGGLCRLSGSQSGGKIYG